MTETRCLKNVVIFIQTSDAYIAAKGRISITCTENANRRNRKPTFRNNPSFRSCISKTDSTLTDSAENLDIVMPMHNLIEYSDNFSVTSGSLWSYYRDEVNDPANKIDNNDNIKNNDKIKTSKNFVYKTNIIGSTSPKISRLKAEVVVPWKYLKNV